MQSLYCDLSATLWKWSLELLILRTNIANKHSTIMGTGIVHFNQYVPAPEHLEVTEDMLSPLNKFCMEKLELSHVKCTKLTPNLQDKHKYVIHYRTLQLYQELGVVLKKIHRVIEFNQRPWLKEYIDFNTRQRKMAKNTFEKNFFKLMNNSVFGKVNVHKFMQTLHSYKI